MERSTRRNTDVHDRERLPDHALWWLTGHLARRLGTGRILDPAHEPAAHPDTEHCDTADGAEEDREEGREVQARPEAGAWQVREDEKEAAGKESSKAMKATI